MRDAAIRSRGTVPRARKGRPSSTAGMRGAVALVSGPAFLLLRRHPGKALAAVLCIIMAGSIVGNAVLFQSGRHPAPLFGHTTPRPPIAGASLPGAVAPVPEPAAVSAFAPPVAAEGAPVARDAVPTRAAGPQKDALTQLLTRQDPAAKGADPRLVKAQRWLKSLGFAVKPDGRMGTATRQALAKFARDHHIPASDALSPKLLQALAGAAGHASR